MRSSAFREALRAKQMVPRILWAAMTMSILVYVLVLYTMVQENTPPDSPPDQTMLYALIGAAVMSVIVSFIVPGMMLSDERLKQHLENKLAKAQKTDPTSSRAPKFEPLERVLLSLVPLTFTSMIVRLALNESVAIFGLVWGFASGTFEPFLPFAIVAVLLNVLSFPTYEKLFGRVEALYRKMG